MEKLFHAAPHHYMICHSMYRPVVSPASMQYLEKLDANGIEGVALDLSIDPSTHSLRMSFCKNFCTMWLNLFH